jgi:hypothetical protein
VVIWSDAPHMRPVDVNMISTDGCARDVMAITRMRFVQEAELGRAAPTRIPRDDGRHCPMHVDAAPEARTLIANGWRKVKRQPLLAACR